MGLLDSIKNLMGGKPEPEPELDYDPTYVEPKPPEVTELPRRAAPEPEPEPAARPIDRMTENRFQGVRDAIEARQSAPDVATADVEEPEGKYTQNRFDPPDVEPQRPGEYVLGPPGPGGSRSVIFVPAQEQPAQGEQQQGGPAVEQAAQGREQPAPDRADPDPGDCPTFEDMNPDHDVDGMDL